MGIVETRISISFVTYKQKKKTSTGISVNRQCKCDDNIAKISDRSVLVREIALEVVEPLDN